MSEDTDTESPIDGVMEDAKKAGIHHVFRERFRAFVELYIRHTPVDELDRILKEKDIHLTIASCSADVFHESVDNEINERWKAFQRHREEAQGEGL
jgi:hypothetical protein